MSEIIQKLLDEIVEESINIGIYSMLKDINEETRKTSIERCEARIDENKKIIKGLLGGNKND